MIDFVKNRLAEFGISKNQKNLVAVSGGVDSMVLLHTLSTLGYKYGVAHCNYQLRGADSDADEALVQTWCSTNKISFHVRRIETKKIAAESKSSLQMVAREQRYQFFEELMNEFGYQRTALAHHLNDRVESLLINVLRGTGIRGLQGMPSQRGKYIRPLIDCTKDWMYDYAKSNKVEFREDKSNTSINYQRNWIRLRVLPMLEQVDNSAIAALSSLCSRTERSLPAFKSIIENELHDVVEDEQFISIPKLEESKIPFTLLNEALADCGFSSAQLFEIFELRKSDSGAMVESKTHKVLRQGEHLIIVDKSKNSPKPMLMYQEFNRYEITSLITESNVALFDADFVDVDNLSLRKWNLGDKFKPLGMDNWKLLSDFFIDQKLSVPEKEEVWLLTQDDEIVWVVNHRIDNRFKVHPSTQKVLKVTASN